jgi:hypothetical protein
MKGLGIDRLSPHPETTRAAVCDDVEGFKILTRQSCGDGREGVGIQAQSNDGYQRPLHEI